MKLFQLILLLSLPTASFAQGFIYDGGPGPGNNYYVATTGSDSGDGSVAHPWLTPGHASSNVVAGDTVIFEDGTYTIPSTNSFRGDWYITPSGTSGNPIVFKAQHKWGAKLVGQGTTVDGSTVIGIFASYVTIKGFEITGGDADGIVMAVDGTTDTNVVVQQNYIHDITAPCDSNGGAAITTGSGNNYEVGNGHFTIDGNLIVNVLDPSGCQPGTLHGAGIAAMLPYATITNNIVISGGRWPIESWHAAHDDLYYGNTVVGGQDGLTVGAGDSGMVSGGNTNTLVENNIVYNQSVVAIQETGTVGTNTYTDNDTYAGVETLSLSSNAIKSGNVNADPVFMNNTSDATGNYNLKSTSTILMDGIPNSGALIDFSGVTRATSGSVPLGAQSTPCGYQGSCSTGVITKASPLCNNHSSSSSSSCNLNSAVAGDLAIFMSKTAVSTSGAAAALTFTGTTPCSSPIKVIAEQYQPNGATKSSMVMFGCIVGTAGSSTPKVTWTGGKGTSTTISVGTYHTTTSWKTTFTDQTANVQSSTASTNCSTGTTSTTTNAIDLIVAVCGVQNTSQTWGALSGWTQRAALSRTDLGWYDKVVSVENVQGTTIPLSASDQWNGFVAAFASN